MSNPQKPKPFQVRGWTIARVQYETDTGNAWIRVDSGSLKHPADSHRFRKWLFEAETYIGWYNEECDR